MTPAPFHAGDFVWTAFPQRENPARPGPLHLAYILVVFDPAHGKPGAVLAAYTTSRTAQTGNETPRGVFRFDREAAAALGQSRPFTLDTRRLAWLPISPSWFPRLGMAGDGVQGHAPKALQRTIWQATEQLLTRHADVVERLGPRWPTQA